MGWVHSEHRIFRREQDDLHEAAVGLRDDAAHDNHFFRGLAELFTTSEPRQLHCWDQVQLPKDDLSGV